MYAVCCRRDAIYATLNDILMHVTVSSNSISRPTDCYKDQFLAKRHPELGFISLHLHASVRSLVPSADISLPRTSSQRTHPVTFVFSVIPLDTD